MKKLYLIVMASSLPRDAISKMLVATPECQQWFYSIPNSLFVYSSLDANGVYNKIKAKFPGNDRLFVTEVPSDNVQGWMPAKHWDIIHANDVVHDYSLKFDGYWVRGDESYLPGYPGIYCVYSCKHSPGQETVVLHELLYIGRAENVRERHQNHEKLQVWESCVPAGETLCYSCAALSKKSLMICEAAMIFKHKPRCNEIGDGGFHHDKTHVATSGCNRFLESDFFVMTTQGGS